MTIYEIFNHFKHYKGIYDNQKKLYYLHYKLKNNRVKKYNKL